MAKKKIEKKIFPELISSFKDKSVLSIMGKDILFYISLSLLFILYNIIILASQPSIPDFDSSSIFGASSQAIVQKTGELNLFLFVLILSTIVFIPVIIFLLGIFKEWIWTGILKQKYGFLHSLMFSGLTIVIYAIAFLIITLIMGLLGAIITGLYNLGTPSFISEALALISFIIVSPFIIHLLNYSSYSFVSGTGLIKSFIGSFTSLKNIKELFLPYLYIMAVFLILGLFSNLITQISKNIFTSFLTFLIFIYFVAWQRLYSAEIFKRIYG